MIKVVGAWEFSFNAPLTEYDMWAYPLRDFGVDEVIMTPISGINCKRNFKELIDIPTAIEENPELTPVYLDEKGTTELSDFEHPENALYILGRAGYSPWMSNNKDGISVKIETKNDGGTLWPHQVICIALHDRMMKDGSNDNRN